MITSKSPRRVFQTAYNAACQALPAHRHRFSPKKFTQRQLMACLVLKELLRLGYRGLAAHLADHLRANEGPLRIDLDLTSSGGERAPSSSCGASA